MKKLYFLLAAFFCTYSLYAQPIPLFATDANAYCMPSNIICTDTSILSGVPVTSWKWTLDGVEVSTQQNPTIPVDGYASGTYQLCMELTYGPPINGVTDLHCKNIQLGQIPTVLAGPDQVLSCINTSVILNVTVSGDPSSYTYIWTGPLGATFNTQSIIVSDVGLYTIEVIDIANCSSSDQVMVLADTSVPNIDVGPNITVDCSSPVNETLNVTVSPAGNYSYQWTTTYGNIVSGANTANPTVDMAGDYTVIVYNNVNGCQVMDFLTVENAPIPINAVSPDVQICEGENVVLAIDAPTAVNYQWSPTGENTASITVSPTTTTTYNVIVNDTNGCTAEASILVSVNPLPNAAISTPGLLCSDDPFDLCTIDDPTVTYQWTNPQGIQTNTNCVTVNNPDLTSNGTYTLLVTDISGCTNSSSFDHMVGPQFTATHTITYPTCHGSNDGSITIDVTGGTAPYTYQWDNGLSCQSTDCVNLAAGIYTIIVTDNNGCSLEEIVTIAEPFLLEVSDYTIECAGDDGTGGAIDITLTGGTPPFAYLWTNAQATEDIEDLIPGIYTVTVTDANNCILVQNFEVGIDCVWPGDTDTNNVVNNYDLLQIGLVYDATGPSRNAASLSWYGQSSTDWGQNVPGSNIDYKHTDTDGNGIIDSNDTLAISLNWGQSHNLLESSASPRNTVPLYVEEDTISQGEMMSLPIILGDMDNPALDIYGIAFSVSYDTSVVSFGSSDISFMNSWLGTKGLDMITIQKDFPISGRVDLAISRTDGMNISGNGEIGRLNIIIEDDILLMSDKANPRGGDEEQPMQFVIDQVKLINNQGAILEVNPLTTTSIITKFPVSSSPNPILDRAIKLYPNPTRELLTIQSGNLKMEQLELFSMMGQLIQIHSNDSNKATLDTTMLDTGTYLVRVKTDQGTIVKRVNVIR